MDYQILPGSVSDGWTCVLCFVFQDGGLAQRAAELIRRVSVHTGADVSLDMLQRAA